MGGGSRKIFSELMKKKLAKIHGSKDSELFMIKRKLDLFMTLLITDLKFILYNLKHWPGINSVSFNDLLMIQKINQKWLKMDQSGLTLNLFWYKWTEFCFFRTTITCNLTQSNNYY